ncbi:MAG: hypothetical protein CMG80_17495 [Marinobacter sp.]|nr:hypothetical protein [Marinobacter sp.]
MMMLLKLLSILILLMLSLILFLVEICKYLLQVVSSMFRKKGLVQLLQQISFCQRHQGTEVKKELE